MSSLYSIQIRSEIIGEGFSRPSCPGVSAREEHESRTHSIDFADQFTTVVAPHFLLYNNYTAIFLKSQGNS